MGDDSSTFSLCLNLHKPYCALRAMRDSDELVMFKKEKQDVRRQEVVFKKLKIFRKREGTGRNQSLLRYLKAICVVLLFPKDRFMNHD